MAARRQRIGWPGRHEIQNFYHARFYGNENSIRLRFCINRVVGVSDDRPSLKFITAIVADDIRREASGKEIIIGVYTSRIILEAISADGGMIFALSLVFETVGIGDIPFELKLIAPSGESPATVHGVIHSKEINVAGQIHTISLSNIPLPITQEGNLIIQARQYEEEWQTVRVLPVSANPDAPGLSAGVPTASSIATGRRSSQSQLASPDSSSPPEPSRPSRPARRRRT